MADEDQDRGEVAKLTSFLKSEAYQKQAREIDERINAAGWKWAVIFTAVAVILFAALPHALHALDPIRYPMPSFARMAATVAIPSLLAGVAGLFFGRLYRA